MYINPFLLGVICTITTEVALLCIAVAVTYRKNKKE